MKKFAILATLLLGTSLTTGCVTRNIISFEDHQKQPVTSMEVIKTTNYVFYRTAEHQFYLCQDTGSALTCNLQCGGKTDLTCPKAMTNGNRGASSNVR